MGERIELPQTPSGTEEEQLKQMYSYLYRMAQTLNHNLTEIGDMDLTDSERMAMMQIITSEESGDGEYIAAYDWQGKESLKSLIIKTAEWVQNKLNEYRINLLGEYVANGKFGRYTRNTELKVDITPEGIQQNYTFEEVVQGLKTYVINAKNYIRTGLLRTVEGLPVYGVQVGKDVVTFEEDGEEVYNDGNKVAEFTADELSFYYGTGSNNVKLASFTGSAITFYSGGNKMAELTPTALKFYYNGTLRSQMDSDGVKFMNGTTKLAELLSSALKFYYNGTLRTQMDSDGVKLYDGSTLLATISSSGITFTNGSTKLAELLTSALKFYYNGTLRTQMDSGGVKLLDGTTKLAEFLTTALNFYYNGTLRTQMDAGGVTILNGTTKYAEFLATALNFYYAGTMRAQMNSSGVTFFNGSDSMASFTPSALYFYNSNSQIMAISNGSIYASGNLDINGGHNLRIFTNDNNQHWQFNCNGVTFFKKISGVNEPLLQVGHDADRDNDVKSGIFVDEDPNATDDEIKQFMRFYLKGTDGYNLILDSRLVANSDPKEATLNLRPNVNRKADLGDEVQGWDKAYINNVHSAYLYSLADGTGSIGGSNLQWYEAWANYIHCIDCYQSSSRDVKHDIQDMESVGDKIDRLRPVTFIYDSDAEEKRRSGLIYEETIDILPEICTGKEEQKEISYLNLVPILLKEIKDLRARVAALEGGNE